MSELNRRGGVPSSLVSNKGNAALDYVSVFPVSNAATGKVKTASNKNPYSICGLDHPGRVSNINEP
jgi:hypothetical protein